jgi:hypothetical protein
LSLLNHNEIPSSRSLMFGIRLAQWHIKDVIYERICGAKFSCDGELVYALFADTSIGVFDATAGLQLRCRITPSAYRAHDQSFWPFWYVY